MVNWIHVLKGTRLCVCEYFFKQIIIDENINWWRSNYVVHMKIIILIWSKSNWSVNEKLFKLQVFLHQDANICLHNANIKKDVRLAFLNADIKLIFINCRSKYRSLWFIMNQIWFIWWIRKITWNIRTIHTSIKIE